MAYIADLDPENVAARAEIESAYIEMWDVERPTWETDEIPVEGRRMVAEQDVIDPDEYTGYRYGSDHIVIIPPRWEE